MPSLIPTDDPISMALRPLDIANGDRDAFEACEALYLRDRRIESAMVERRALVALPGPLGVRARTLLARITAPRPPFAGVPLDRPRIMGIVNATPNSFHVRHPGAEAAIAHAHAQTAAGADIVDIGGESTRPGAQPISEAEEFARVLPVLKALSGAPVPVSIDTYKPGIMGPAIDSGASIVNDVNALQAFGALSLVALAGASAVLMHKKGEPATMNLDPHYEHAPYEIFRFLEARIAACEEAGIPRARLAVDPGFGFGMSFAHKYQVLDALSIFHGLGCALLVGISGKLPGGAEASLAAARAAAAQGAQIVRVHDVAATRDALGL